jgi:hypothetical protein
MVFNNPFASNLSGITGEGTGGLALFYLANWPEGPATALLHVFSGLDPHPFLTYVTVINAPYEPVLQVLTVLLLGVAGVGSAAKAQALWHRSRTEGLLASTEPAYAYLALIVLGTVAILGYSAAEYRFGVLVLTVAGLLAVPGALRLASWRRGGLLAFAFGVAAGSIDWIALSVWVVQTSEVWRTCAEA